MSKRYVSLLFLVGKKKNIHHLSREINMTTGHLSNVTDQWQKEGILVKERKGREIDLELTEKGQELVKLVQQYDELFKKDIPADTAENK